MHRGTRIQSHCAAGCFLIYWNSNVARLRAAIVMTSPLRLLPPTLRTQVRRRLVRLARPAWLGTLHRTTPLSDHWGMERGTPIDRHYIARFLDAHRDDIHGHVLEIKDRGYVDMFGAAV